MYFATNEIKIENVCFLNIPDMKGRVSLSQRFFKPHYIVTNVKPVRPDVRGSYWRCCSRALIIMLAENLYHLDFDFDTPDQVTGTVIVVGIGPTGGHLLWSRLVQCRVTPTQFMSVVRSSSLKILSISTAPPMLEYEKM